MHPFLSALESELRELATTVQGSSGDERPASLMHSNWSLVGVDRNELANLATRLADRIRDEGGDDLNVNETLLSQYSQRLQFLKVNTIPHLWTVNANHAIPAYLLTLESLERALDPVLAVDPASVASDAKTAKAIQTKIRGLVSRVAELEPKVEVLQTMADQIAQAHATADQLPTDMASLREAREEIQSLRGLVAADKEAADGLLEKMQEREAKLQSSISSSEAELNKRKQEWDALLQSSTESANSIIAKCNDAMRTSTSLGLAGAFHEQAKSLTISMWYWVGGLICALLAGAYFGGEQLHQLTDAIQSSTPSMIVWTRLLISLLAVGGPIWFAWLATKQIGQRFRLAEDYAYKASISRAYEGYRREAIELDVDFQTKLFASALARLDEQPLRFVEHETHGSPWHELLSSDVFKEAIRIAPELVGQFTSLARETVESAKALRRKPTVKVKAEGNADETEVIE